MGWRSIVIVKGVTLTVRRRTSGAWSKSYVCTFKLSWM